MTNAITRACGLAGVLLAALAAAGRAQGAQIHVAVFNFQMKAGPADWAWLEKGLADQITTDFTQSRRLTVVARDEMQLVAGKMSWTPEMATGGGMEEARKALRMDRIVTGVYRVEGERIEVVAQVVDVTTRRELARKTAAGPAREVLGLQKRISAELLGWFSDSPPEQILPHLPVWTRSLEATRGLYEGLHLYDQGRYEEAWLKFRQAWRTDPGYLEAHYWVGRMYYFMDRYEHARRAYEAFVYMDAAHPRIGDAVREYLHTYEKLNAPPETLLALYDDFTRRFGEARIHNVLDMPGAVPARVWLRARSGQVLLSLGRNVEAAEIASLAIREIYDERSERAWGAYTAAMEGVYRHNQQTGHVLMTPGLAAHHTYDDSGNNIVRFGPGQTEVTYRRGEPDSIHPIRDEDGRNYYPNSFRWHFLLAPDGYVFRKITVWPLVSGDGKIGSGVHLHSFTDCGAAYYVPMEKAARDGFVFDNLPPSGLFHLHFFMAANDRRRDPRVRFEGVRVAAQLEKVGEHAAVEVRSPSTECFWTYLQDRRMGRKGPGVIGPLPPGPQTLELRASPAHAVRKVSVTVEPGKTARLDVPLEWAPGSPWRSWSAGTRVPLPVASRAAERNTLLGLVSILPEEGGVRLFWSFEDDIWTAFSVDGKTFGPPCRLELPLSTGWAEGHVRVVRAESGRYVMGFVSDREAQHRHRAYLCWSRDGVHWSRPAMVSEAGGHFDLIQDADGHLVWAENAPDGTIRLKRSRDGLAWSPLGAVPMPGSMCSLRLVRRDDGVYELFYASLRIGVGKNEYHAEESERTTVWYSRSDDLLTWTPPEPVAHMDIGQATSVAAFPTAEGTVLAVFRGQTTRWGMYLWLFRRNPDGQWVRSQPQHGIAKCGGDMTWSRRWGYLIAWVSEPGSQFPAEPAGPFLLAGPTIEPLLDTKGKPQP